METAIEAPAQTAALVEVRKSPSLWKRFRRHRMAVVGLGFIVAVIFVAIFAPFLGTMDPTKTSLSDSLQPPSREHWLGTDLTGRDVWSRLAYASRVSLIAGVVSIESASAGAAIIDPTSKAARLRASMRYSLVSSRPGTSMPHLR